LQTWSTRDRLTSDVHLHNWRPTSPPRFWIHHPGIHHTGFLPEDIGSFSMRYKSGIVVSINLIFEAFEYVVLKLLLIIEGLLRHYASDVV
jgi:hypothetical protein